MSEIKNKLIVSDNDKLALAQMAYGENAGEDLDTLKMTIQSAINRLLSGRSKEFGATIPDVLKKGYYAVSKNSPLYQQAVTGKFPDITSKAKFSTIQKLVDAIIGDEDFGKVQFYFRPEEAKGLKSKLKRLGNVGVYETYSY